MDNGFISNKSILPAYKIMIFKSWHPLREKPPSSGYLDENQQTEKSALLVWFP